MNRRKIIGYCTTLGILGALGLRYGRRLNNPENGAQAPTVEIQPVINDVASAKLNSLNRLDIDSPKLSTSAPSAQVVPHIQDSVVDYLYKIQNFDENFKSDILIARNQFYVLKRLSRRLNRAQTVVGYLNFSILDFPMLLRYSKNYPAIGKFSKPELDLIEQLVFRDAGDYGFYGEKLISNVNDKITKNSIFKVPGAGQYIFKSESYGLLQRIKLNIGDSVILTSGVRGLMKQLQLFSSKAVSTKGNLSRASRSLAPPGYSYHGIGDFDIGEVGLGKLNFTEKFSETEVFNKLVDQGFINIRYQHNNKFGVRYEPWHIKVS